MDSGARHLPEAVRVTMWQGTTLLAACPEHLSCKAVFFLQCCLRGLALPTAGVFRNKEEFGCLHIFFPQPSKKKKTTFKILVCY